MKKSALIFALILCLCCLQSEARMSLSVVGGSVPVASCAVNNDYIQTTANAYSNIGYADGLCYVGQTITPTGSICVCKVTFKLTKVQGDITGETYTVSIYQDDYTDPSLADLVGVSAGVAGSQSWSDTDVDFTFSPCLNLSSSYAYTVTIHDGVGTYNETNVAKISKATPSQTTLGLYVEHKCDKTTNNASSSNDLYFKLWTQ